jgi:hypothetical protein
MSETEYTKSKNPLHKIEDQITNYNWFEDDNNSNTLVLAKQVIKFQIEFNFHKINKFFDFILLI